MTPSEKAAHDDIFFSIIVCILGGSVIYNNWIESDWLGFAGGIFLSLFGFGWLLLRINHIRNKEKVFGGE